MHLSAESSTLRELLRVGTRMAVVGILPATICLSIAGTTPSESNLSLPDSAGRLIFPFFLKHPRKRSYRIVTLAY